MSSAAENSNDNSPLVNLLTPVSQQCRAAPNSSRRGTGKKICILPPVISTFSCSSPPSSSPLLHEFRTCLQDSPQVRTSSENNFSAEEDYRTAAIHGYAIGMLGGDVLSPTCIPTKDGRSNQELSPVFSIAPPPLFSASTYAQCNLSELERVSLSAVECESGSFIVPVSSSRDTVLLYHGPVDNLSLQSGYLDREDDEREVDTRFTHHADPFSFFRTSNRQSVLSFGGDGEHASSSSSVHQRSPLVGSDCLRVDCGAASSFNLSFSRSTEEGVNSVTELELPVSPKKKKGGKSSCMDAKASIYERKEVNPNARSCDSVAEEREKNGSNKLVKKVSSPLLDMCSGIPASLSPRLLHVSSFVPRKTLSSPKSSFLFISSVNPNGRSSNGSFRVLSLMSSLRDSLSSPAENGSSFLKECESPYSGIIVRSQGSRGNSKLVFSNSHVCSDGRFEVRCDTTQISRLQQEQLCPPFMLFRKSRKNTEKEGLSSEVTPIVHILSTSKLFLRIAPPTWSEVQNGQESMDSVRSSVSEI